MKYSTTNKEGYREYKSPKHICATCPFLAQCTESKDHQKVVTRHVWQAYMEEAEHLRCELDLERSQNGLSRHMVEVNFY